MKGLDYSIYICNDLFNSNTDYYDYNDQIEDGNGNGDGQNSTQNPLNSSQISRFFKKRYIRFLYL